MDISTPDQPRDRRFQLRATATEETLIKVAAERQGVNVTDFIMRSACEKAEQACLTRRDSCLTTTMESVHGSPRSAAKGEAPPPPLVHGIPCRQAALMSASPNPNSNREAASRARPHALRLRQYNAQFVACQIRLDESAGRFRPRRTSPCWGSCCRLLCANDRLRSRTREPGAHCQGSRQPPNRHRALSSIGSGHDPTGQGTRQSAFVRCLDANRRGRGHRRSEGCHGSRHRRSGADDSMNTSNSSRLPWTLPVVAAAQGSTQGLK